MVPLFFILWPWCLTLFFENFNLPYNFWTVSLRAFIFHMNSSCDKTFSCLPWFLTLWPRPWSFTCFWKTLTFLITFEQWELKLIFHINIPCEKTFLWLPLFFTLWPWLWGLTHFLKTLTLPINFERWVLDMWYFTWVFLEIRPFSGFIIFFFPDGLDLGVWPICGKL